MRKSEREDLTFNITDWYNNGNRLNNRINKYLSLSIKYQLHITNRIPTTIIIIKNEGINDS